MFKRLFVVGAVLGGFGPPAHAFWDKKPAPLPSGVLQVLRPSPADSHWVGRSSGDFRGPIFATPMPPGPGRVTLPGGGPLAAPVITPLAATHPGHLGKKFEVIPAGDDPRPFLTKHPERFVGSDACESGCVSGPRAWADFEFLYWATQGIAPPPTVTTGPPTAAPGVAGVIGQTTTLPLFGGNRTLNQFRPGFRTELGYWFDPARRWGISGRFYFLGAVNEELIAGGNGFNVVNVPQTAQTPAGLVQAPLYVAYPALTTGSVVASTHSDFIGGDVNLRRNLGGDGACRLELLGGYRFLHLGDNVLTAYNMVPLSPLVGTPIAGEDATRTRNQFHGGQVGFAATGRHGPFSVEVQSTVALGVSATEFESTNIRTFPGVLPAAQGGIGPFVLDRGGQVNYFAVVPEVGVTVGWNPSETVRLTVGYNFLYWSTVRRAQELAVPGTSGPTDFWVQGINAGFELRY